MHSGRYGISGPQRDGGEALLPEIEEIVAAAELLEAADEVTLDRVLARQMRNAAAITGARLGPDMLWLLTSIVKPALRGALPQLGRTPTPFARSRAGSLVSAGQMFGIELEGLSPEDAELSAARRAVRFARAAASRVVRAPYRMPPAIAARHAALGAARRWAPGLVPSLPDAKPAPAANAPREEQPAPPPGAVETGAVVPGTWVRSRDGRTIVVVC